MSSVDSDARSQAITWSLLVCAVASEVTATLCLRAALDVPGLYVIVAIGYVMSFVLLALLLRRGMGLGVVYGTWGASGVALTAVLSALIFGEHLTLTVAIGIALVIAGVLAVQLGAQRAHVTAPADTAGSNPPDSTLEETA
jgi:small multidrug resistance pump